MKQLNLDSHPTEKYSHLNSQYTCHPDFQTCDCITFRPENDKLEVARHIAVEVNFWWGMKVKCDPSRKRNPLYLHLAQCSRWSESFAQRECRHTLVTSTVMCLLKIPNENKDTQVPFMTESVIRKTANYRQSIGDWVRKTQKRGVLTPFIKIFYACRKKKCIPTKWCR